MIIITNMNITKDITTNKYATKERRVSDILVSSGTGVIFFGLWSVVKTILQIILSQQSIASFANVEDVALDGTFDATTYVIISAILAFVMLGIDLGLRLYAGLSARADGRGKKKSIAYIIVAFVLIALGVISVVSTIISVSYLEGTIIDKVVTLIVDITALLALVELVISGIRLKRIRRKSGVMPTGG